MTEYRTNHLIISFRECRHAVINILGFLFTNSGFYELTLSPGILNPVAWRHLLDPY